MNNQKKKEGVELHTINMWGMLSTPEIIVDIGPTLHVPSQSVQN